MNELMKVRDVSLKYNVSTRALKYYEDMGLIQSTRTEAYAYRVYDKAAVKRLEQILVLRKLDIKIKDIQKILLSDQSETLLEVLGQKVTDIDDEVALLRELREMVLAFIRRLETVDFHSGERIDKLCEKATPPAGNVRADAARLDDIAKRARRLLSVRTMELPKRKVLLYDSFDALPNEVKALNDVFYPTRFARFNPSSFDVENFVVLPADFSLEAKTDFFESGLYAVGVLQGDTQWGIETDTGLLYKWAGENGFQLRENAALFWNTLPAVETQPPLLEMYLPIAPQSTGVCLEDSAECRPLQLRTGQAHKIDLKTLVCIEPAAADLFGGELKLTNDDNDVGGARTAEKYRFPLAVRVRAKTDSTNIRLGYEKGALVFNWGVAANSLIGRDISDGSFFHRETGGYIPINQYADILWILETDYMAVAVNGQMRLYETDMPYMKSAGVFCDTVLVNAAFRSTVTVSDLEIIELGHQGQEKGK